MAFIPPLLPFRPSASRAKWTCTTPGPRHPPAQEARLELWREVAALKTSLETAVTAQNFSDAAQIRDKIESLSLADDYFRTQRELETAVAEERFVEAARLRDVLKTLDPPPSTASKMKIETGEVSNSSTVVTDSIQVCVESYYMPELSNVTENRFWFGYKVRICNQGAFTCQLVSRTWNIRAGEGAETEVRGSGVVGRQPVLEPGDTFEYSSKCPVESAERGVVGCMEGRYSFCRGDVGDERFSVDVGRFYFVLPDNVDAA